MSETKWEGGRAEAASSEGKGVRLVVFRPKLCFGLRTGWVLLMKGKEVSMRRDWQASLFENRRRSPPSPSSESADRTAGSGQDGRLGACTVC